MLPRVHPVLAGIYDSSGGLGPGEARRVADAVSEGEHVDVLSGGRLVCARAPGTGPGPARGPVDGGPRCLLVGRVYRATDLPARPDSRAGGGADEDEALERRIRTAYRRRGAGILDDLSGDFVLVLWDEERGRGLVAQDQLGGRSLYYHARGGRLYFASDIAPLLRLLPACPAPDEVTLAHRLASSSAPMERTVYEGVGRLCAGHLLELGPDAWRKRRYWFPEYRSPPRMSSTELQDGLWRAASRAVRRRMDGAEGLGIIMSGGLDSTVVAAAAMEGAAEGYPVPRGYSAVFPGRPELDESDRIELLADHLGLEGTRVEPRAGGVLPLMLDYLRTWEVPLCGPGYLLERPLLEHAARDGTTVILDGQGGDEVFGLSPFLLADRIRRGRLLSSFRLARRFPSGSDSPQLRRSLILWKRFGLEPALPGRLHERRHRRRSPPRIDGLTPEAARLVTGTDGGFDWRRKRSGPLWWAFKAHLLVEGREKLWLPEYVRHRAAMAGLEARPPLLDLGLVQFSLGHPPELDFDRYSRPSIRGALRGRVPEKLRLDRRKSNLAPYYHEGWIGPDLSMVRSILLDPSAPVRRFVRSGTLEALLADPPAFGGPGWMAFGSRIWGLLTVELFLRHLEGPRFAERVLGARELARPGGRVVPGRGVLAPV